MLGGVGVMGRVLVRSSTVCVVVVSELSDAGGVVDCMVLVLFVDSSPWAVSAFNKAAMDRASAMNARQPRMVIMHTRMRYLFVEGTF